MVKHAIVIASEGWCREASAGRVKVYDFIRERRRGIRSLGPGSVCVVLTKAEPGKPPAFYGEFAVVEVREVSASEYEELVRRGLIRNPLELEPNERRWIIRFDEFKEYEHKILKKDLCDVKTSTSKKPICERPIKGLTYIDDNVLEAIRERALKKSEELLTHECIELKLIELGNALGFNTYTADPSKKCGDVVLGSLTNLSPERPLISDKLRTIDVIWYKHPNYKLFEVVLTSDIRNSLLKFAEVADLNADYFIVAQKQEENRFGRSIGFSTFSKIRNRTRFISVDDLKNIHEITMKWRKSVEILKLPYLSEQ
jgi:hypothetical protein